MKEAAGQLRTAVAAVQTNEGLAGVVGQQEKVEQLGGQAVESSVSG
jgi:hypothetical protein